MPGIVGIVGKNTYYDSSDKVGDMIDAMMKEQFYSSTTYSHSKLGVYLGSVCIKGSFPDCMPIYNEKKDLMMLFSGECFTEPEEIHNLKILGHEFSQGNASYLIHLYEEKGEDFFKDLNGWYSGIIVDIKREEVILFNDRFGMQRIYYYEDKDSFYFSSEAKALLKILPSLRSIDLKSMGEYLNYDSVLENRTFFSGIRLLPSGSKWMFSVAGINKEQYFYPESWENQSALSKNEFLDKACSTFCSIVPRYFNHGDVGMALTGGLDTRSVLAAVGPEPGQLPCYTYGGIYRDSLDVKIARRVAKSCGQAHTAIRLDNQYLSDFQSNIEKAVFITDGLANVSIADEVYMNKISREIAPVKMTGKFGSQVLRGLAGLRDRLTDSRLINNEFIKYISFAKETFSKIKMGHPLSFFLFNEIPWFWSGFTVSELSQLMVRSPYLDNDFIHVLYQAPPDFLESYEFHIALMKRANPKYLEIMTDKGMGREYGTVRNMLAKQYYHIIGMADKIYTWDRIPYSLTHWVARFDHLLKPLHVDALVKGHAYFRHYRTWFRDELSQYLKDLVLDNKTLQRPYWDVKFVEKMIQDHISGKGNYTREINKVMTVELIHRTLIDK